MASYLGTYQEEFGKDRQLVKLTVYLVSISQGIIATSFDTDSLYLPALFLANTVPFISSSNQGYCQLVCKLRRIRAYINTDSFLSFPNLWRGINPQYNELINELKNNSNITTIGIDGEVLPSSWVSFYAGGNN